MLGLIVNQGSRVRIREGFQAFHPNKPGVIEGSRNVGLMPETESKEYLVRVDDSAGGSCWINERYLEPIVTHMYEVTIRDPDTDFRRSLMFKADDFGHAEEQARPYLAYRDEIITIVKQFEVDMQDHSEAAYES